MGKEVNINLGEKPQEKGKSCFDGVCPPNPLHLLEQASGALPMILGLGLTFLKMDQFQRPLANTAMQMIEGLAPQIEKNAMKFGAVINSLTEASHNVSAKMTKHPDDFTKEDKVHLVQMLINDENNYFDSYDSALDFLSYQNPGFVKALYKTLMANMPEGDKQIVHANSREGKENIKKNSDPDRKPVSTDRYTDLHDNLLDGHIAKAKKGLALSTVGLEGKGLIKGPKAAKAIKKSTDINTDDPSLELSENVARLNRKAEIDDAAASKSLKQSLKGDEEGGEKILAEGKMTPNDINRLNKLDAKSSTKNIIGQSILTDKESKEKKDLENKKAEAGENFTDNNPENEDIKKAETQIKKNSASAKATLASEEATRAEAEVKAAKAKVDDANKKLDDANEKVKTAESVKKTAQNAVNKNKNNKDAELTKELETKRLDAVKAEGNAKEQVQKLTSALKEAEAAAEAANVEAEAAKAEKAESEAETESDSDSDKGK